MIMKRAKRRKSIVVVLQAWLTWYGAPSWSMKKGLGRLKCSAGEDCQRKVYNNFRSFTHAHWFTATVVVSMETQYGVGVDLR